jgi:hypothetical protein
MNARMPQRVEILVKLMVATVEIMTVHTYILTTTLNDDASHDDAITVAFAKVLTLSNTSGTDTGTCSVTQGDC